MKTFKIIDVFLQAAAMLGCLVYYIRTNDNETLLFSYFLVGFFQVISMVVHFGTGNLYSHTARSYYHWTALVTILLMPLGFVFLILLYLAPFMALFYLSLCVNETKRFLTKPQRIFA